MQRRALNHAISTITFDLRRLADRAEEQIASVTHALVAHDPALARRMLNWDDGDHALRRKIERGVIATITAEQPAARDLRGIVAAMHMAAELERMAEHASGIARLTIRLSDEAIEIPDIPYAITEMQRLVCAMLRRAMRAYVEHDADLAITTAALDEEVDALHVQVLRVMLTYMMQDQRLVTGATYLVWVAHNLERIGDRATNLCERVLFAERGSLIDLQRAGADMADPALPHETGAPGFKWN